MPARPPTTAIMHLLALLTVLLVRPLLAIPSSNLSESSCTTHGISKCAASFKDSPSGTRPPEDVVDEYLFDLTLEQFTMKRRARDPPTLDWESDECTHSPDNPLGFPFKPACQRHDFGYRNYKRQQRFTDAAKVRIDKNFRAEYVPSCCPFVMGKPPPVKPLHTYTDLKKLWTV